MPYQSVNPVTGQLLQVFEEGHTNQHTMDALAAVVAWLGCDDWVMARVETAGEPDVAMKAACESKAGVYIEIIGGRMDMPEGLANARTRLKELYGIEAEG